MYWLEPLIEIDTGHGRIAFGPVTREKVGESQYNNFPEWPSWSLDRVREFQEICGDLQSELGYGKEAQWIEMTKKANKLY